MIKQDNKQDVQHNEMQKDEKSWCYVTEHHMPSVACRYTETEGSFLRVQIDMLK